MNNFTKIFKRKSQQEIDYTTTQNALEELHILEKQKGWAIFESLRVLREGKADSFSFTKDSPYHYFYARITEENVIFKLRTHGKETEFRIPLEQLV